MHPTKLNLLQFTQAVERNMNTLQRWLLVGCLTSQQYASVSQGQICSDKWMCCHTEIEVADQTFYLTHSILTLGQPVPALTPFSQAPGRVATGQPIVKLLVWLHPEKSLGRKWESNPLGQRSGLSSGRCRQWSTSKWWSNAHSYC